MEWVPAASTRVRCAQPSLPLTQPHTDAQGNMRMGSLAFRSLSLSLFLSSELKMLSLWLPVSPLATPSSYPLTLSLFFCWVELHAISPSAFFFVFGGVFLLFLNWFLWLSPLSELINVSLLVQPLVAVLLGGSEFIYFIFYIYLFFKKENIKVALEFQLASARKRRGKTIGNTMHCWETHLGRYSFFFFSFLL